LYKTFDRPRFSIDPTSLLAPGARIGEGAEIGPFCRIGPDVVLAEGVRLHSHVVIEGHTSIGARTEIYPFTALGGPPQHLRYRGEPTRLEIGSDCVLREQISIHRGTAHGGGVTVIGNNVLVMTQVHVGHDARVGNHVVLAGKSSLSGHVLVEDHAIIGGASGVHQFCRIGAYAMVGACAAVPLDLIPYGLAAGNHARLTGLNLIGLKRMGLPRSAIHAIRGAFRDLFLVEGPPFRARIDEVAERYAGSAEVGKIIAFLRADARRSILPARKSAMVEAHED
jgi:UDP-N-acetylglucosamine acyltransferase